MCSQTMAEITASRPVSLRGLYASAKSDGPAAQRRLDVADPAGRCSVKSMTACDSTFGTCASQ